MNTLKEAPNNNQIAQKWEKTSMTLAAYAAQRHVPLGGTFELTPRCNLRCKMCYVRLDPWQMDKIGRERTAQEWISIARDAAAAGTLNLLLTGGEPLMRQDFDEMYSAFSEMGFIITLNTNAALLTPQLLELFKRYPPTATNVTLYGASYETYERVCGNGDGFRRTLEGLEMLSEVSTVLEIRTTFIKDNMHELKEIREIAKRYTKRFAINTAVNKAVRGAESKAENCRMTPSQIFDLIEKNEEYYMEPNIIYETPQADMDAEMHTVPKDYGFSLPPRVITCLAAKSMYWITWDGKMIPCGSFSSPFTLPFEEGFKQAWDKLPSLFDNVSVPPECSRCEFADGKCQNCPASLQAETGSFDKVSDYLCAVAREREPRRKKQAKSFHISTA